MYLVGQGHEHMGPGTSMVQRIDWTRAQESQLQSAFRGLGCAGRCGGMCGSCGGLGLFDGGMDLSTWGWPEWGIVVLGGYVLASTVFATGRGVRAVAAMPKRRRLARAAKYRARAAELSKR